MKTAYVLYWVMRSLFGSSAALSSGAVRVDSLEACHAGAAAQKELLKSGESGDWGELPNDYYYKCEPAK